MMMIRVMMIMDGLMKVQTVSCINFSCQTPDSQDFPVQQNIQEIWIGIFLGSGWFFPKYDEIYPFMTDFFCDKNGFVLNIKDFFPKYEWIHPKYEWI